MRRPILAVVLAAIALVTACSSSPTSPAPSKLQAPSAAHDNVPVDTLNRGYVIVH